MSRVPDSPLAALDAHHHLHPFSDPEALEKAGQLVLARGEGVFVEDDQGRRYLRADWQTWYWVLYGGYGALGNDRGVLTELDEYVADVGLGFQTALSWRDYTFFFGVLAAKAIESSSDVKVRVSFKSFH